MALAVKTTDQFSDDDALRALKSAEGNVFEAGYDHASDKIDLAVVPGVTNEIRFKINTTYAAYGGHEKVLMDRIAKANLKAADLPPAGIPENDKKREERKNEVLKLAAELYGPFLFDSKHIYEGLKFGDPAASPDEQKLAAVLKEVLADHEPGSIEKLDGRPHLRAALAKLVDRNSADRVKFLAKAVGSVDYAELVEEEGKLEPMQEELKAINAASGHFRSKKYTEAVKAFEGLDGLFDREFDYFDPPTSTTTATKKLRTIPDADKKGLKLYIENLKDETDMLDRRLYQKSGINPGDRKEAEHKIQNNRTIQRLLERAQLDKVMEKLKALFSSLKVCADLGIAIHADVSNADLKNLVANFEKCSEDFSLNDLIGLFKNNRFGSKNLITILTEIDPNDIAKKIATESGPKRKKIAEQDSIVKKLKEKEAKSLHMTDEDLALAINKQLLAENPKTASLDKGRKEEVARARLLEDLTAMDNDDYFRRQAEKVDPKLLEAKVIKDKILKFNFEVTDPNDHSKSKVESPLSKLSIDDLKDDLALEKALRMNKIDWKGAFVLMLGLEKLGETASDRYGRVEKLARRLLARELGDKPYSAKCEQAFQDQVALLKPHMDTFFDKFDATSKVKQAEQVLFVDDMNHWLKEALKQGKLTVDDWESTVQMLEDNGYFTSERLLKRGKIGVMPKDEALAILKTMFEKIPTSQARRDRARVVGKEAYEVLGKGLIGGTLSAGATVGKGLFWDLPIKYLEYMAWEPLKMGVNVLTHPLHPVKAAKESYGKIKGKVKADLDKIKGAPKKLGEKAKEKVKSGAKKTGKSILNTFRHDLGDDKYAKRSHDNVDKMKERALAGGKRAKKPVLKFKDPPFINLSHYKGGGQNEAKAA